MQPQDTPIRTIRTVKIWIKAFIPATYEGAVLVPGEGEHAGKTMLTNAFLVSRTFLTDQRGFSDDIHADARMHSEIEVDVVKGRENYQFHHCYDTIEVDPKSGEEKCRAQGETHNMRFHDFKVAPDQRRYTVRIKAGSKNPCIKLGTLKLAANLDFEGGIIINVGDDPTTAVVTFTGKVEKYPAFEMYASANNGAPQMVFQVGVAPDAKEGDILGKPERAVTGKAHLVG
ncbi:MAG: hypothetical protein GC204_06760 [Chloroflexi bacterium]|nr:hypothetical protein [Chloroflexota bacterium]